MANPTAHENPGDFEPDGTWYSMVSARGLLYAVEPNHGELDSISAKGVSDIEMPAVVSDGRGNDVTQNSIEPSSEGGNLPAGRDFQNLRCGPG